MTPFPRPFPGLGHRICGESHLRTLRAWRIDDAPVLVEAWADPEIARWCGVPRDPTLATAERWIDGWEGRRASGASLDLVVVDDAGAVVGEVGVHPVDGELELGWWVLPGRRRQGIATAAVIAFSAWLREARPGERLVARIPSGHVASERVAAAAGLAPAGAADATHERWRERSAGADRVRA